MKKIISFLLSVIMLQAFAVIPFEAYAAGDEDYSLYAVERKEGAIKLASTKESVSSGETFTVSVEVTEDFSASVASVIFTYDTSVFTLESVNNGLITAEEYSDGVIRGTGGPGDGLFTGTLFSATFKVKNGVAATNYRFTFSQSQFVTESAVMIVPTAANLTIKINGGSSAPTPKPTATPGPTAVPKTPNVSMDIKTLDYVHSAVLNGNMGNVTLSLKLAENAVLNEGQCILIKTALEDGTILSVDMWNGVGNKFERQLSVPDGHYIKTARADLVDWYDVFPYFKSSVTIASDNGIDGVKLVGSDNNSIDATLSGNVYESEVTKKGVTYTVEPVYKVGYHKKDGDQIAQITRKSPTASVPAAEANTYNIVYNMQNHGTAPTASKYTYGGEFLVADNLTETGYTFGGWYYGTGENAVRITDANSLENVITENTGNDITLTAKWTANEYEVTYNTKGHGTAPAASKYTYGGDFTVADDLTATGYTFGGWYLDETFVTPANANNIKSLINDETTGITVYAQWTANEYDVTYNAKGHGTAPAASKYTYDGDFTVADNLTATGYTFGGWYLDDATFQTEATVAKIKEAINDSTAGITIYAKWEANVYTVTYNANELGEAPPPTTYTYDGNFTPGTISTIGYNFGGWFLDNETFEKGATAENIKAAINDSTEGITIYAKWTASGYNVTYDAKGHGTAPVPGTYTYPDDFTLAGDLPNVVGYTFGGWYLDDTTFQTEANAANIKSKIDNGETAITIYAKWTENNYTVTYNENGHGEKPQNATYTYDANFTVAADLTATGYTFEGWYSDDGKIATADDLKALITQSTDQGDKTIALTAKWTVNEYDVIYNTNGHGTAPDASKYTYDGEFTVADNLTETGYTFDGWYYGTGESAVRITDANSLKNVITENTGNDITLTAKWTAKEYTVTYNTNGHGTAPAASKYTYDGEFTVADALTETGYTFGGWFLDGEFKTEVTSDNIRNSIDNSTDGITIYAKWTAISDPDPQSDPSLQSFSLAADGEPATDGEGDTPAAGGDDTEEDSSRSYTTDIEIVNYNGNNNDNTPENGYYAHLCFSVAVNTVNATDKIVFAVYTADGRLKSVNICNIGDIKEYNEWVTYLAPENDETMSGATVKSFVWNGENGIQPLASSNSKQFPAA